MNVRTTPRVIAPSNAARPAAPRIWSAPRARALAAIMALAGAVPLSGGSAPLQPGSRPAAPPLAGQTGVRGEAQALKARAAERMKALQREADDLARREQTLLGELRRLEVERDLRTEELNQAEADLAAIAEQIERTNAQIGDLERRLAIERPALEARLVEIYKLGEPGYARLLLSIEDPRALGRAVRLAAAMARIDRERVARYRQTADQLTAVRGTLEERAAQAATLKVERQKARASAEGAVRARADLVRQIDQRRDLTAQLVGELQMVQDRLQRTISALTLNPTAQAALDPTVLPLRPFRGDLVWPAAGEIVGEFGPQRHARFGTSVLQNGIEIAAAAGAPVVAVHGGRVAFADVYAGYGQLVIVDHGTQAYSLYGYLGGIAVAAGAHLAAGGQIGTVGRGPSGAPSLYFELRVDGKPVDPVQWLKAR